MAKKELVAIGRYHGKVIDHDIGKASTGTPQVGVQFEFVDKSGETRSLTWYGYFSPALISSENGVFKQLRELGWDVEKNNWNLAMLGRKSEANPAGGALMGLEADITVGKKDTQNGEEGREIRWINSEGGVGMKDRADTPEDIAQFIKEVKANASGAAPARPAAAKTAKPADKPAAAGAAVAPKGDDLPF